MGEYWLKPDGDFSTSKFCKKKINPVNCRQRFGCQCLPWGKHPNLVNMEESDVFKIKDDADDVYKHYM